MAENGSLVTRHDSLDLLDLYLCLLYQKEFFFYELHANLGMFYYVQE